MHGLSNDPRFARVTVFTVDFDSGKDVLREWKVAQQSTLLAFKGKVETRRSSGEVAPEAIQKVFEAAL